MPTTGSLGPLFVQAALVQGKVLLGGSGEVSLSLCRGRVLLISDGLANQGITDPYRLGETAAAASEDRMAVTTIGVGLEFNEHLL